MGLKTRGLRDAGTWYSGTTDSGTLLCGTWDAGTWDAKTSGHEDMPINKQHPNFAKFAISNFQWSRKRKVLCDGEFASS